LTVKDTTRWKQNDDGTWSRRISVFSEQGLNATAAAIRQAELLGIEIADLTGTGKGGKITKADVEAFNATR